MWERWFEILRSMTVDERVDIARQLTLSYQRELFTIVRAKHPDLPEEEIRLKVAARRLGRDVVLKVFGRDIDPD